MKDIYEGEESKEGSIPPCPFGSKSDTKAVHILAAKLPNSSLAGSLPNGVMFCTGLAKTKGIYTHTPSSASYQIKLKGEGGIVIPPQNAPPQSYSNHSTRPHPTDTQTPAAAHTPSSSGKAIFSEQPCIDRPPSTRNAYTHIPVSATSCCPIRRDSRGRRCWGSGRGGLWLGFRLGPSVWMLSHHSTLV